jgi:hypothetical protein
MTHPDQANLSDPTSEQSQCSLGDAIGRAQTAMEASQAETLAPGLYAGLKRAPRESKCLKQAPDRLNRRQQVGA